MNRGGRRDGNTGLKWGCVVTLYFSWCEIPVPMTRNNQERAVKLCFKVLLCENRLETLFYQQKKQDADTSSEGLRFGFSSPSPRAPSPRLGFPPPLSSRAHGTGTAGCSCNGCIAHDLELYDPVQSDHSCLIRRERFLSFFFLFTLFSLKRHTFSVLNCGYGQSGNSCACTAGQRGVPAGTHFVSWLNCYQNSPGHSAPQIIFP